MIVQCDKNDCMSGTWSPSAAHVWWQGSKWPPCGCKRLGSCPWSRCRARRPQAGWAVLASQPASQPSLVGGQNVAI